MNRGERIFKTAQAAEMNRPKAYFYRQGGIPGDRMDMDEEDARLLEEIRKYRKELLGI